MSVGGGGGIKTDLRTTRLDQGTFKIFMSVLVVKMCSDRSIKCNFPPILYLGNCDISTDRPTDRRTDVQTYMRDHREIILPIAFPHANSWIILSIEPAAVNND